MAMAEVAATPSHTSATGATVPAVAASSSRSKSPLLFASSSTPRANLHTHQHPHSQVSNDQRQPVQSQYNPTNSPGDGSSSSFFSHHQRLSPPGSMLLSTSGGNIPRGLPPIISPMTSASQPGPSVNDPRQPISPRTVSMGLSDSAQGLDGISGDTAPRKRSKVSRACDECRRKKIRCDATSESGVEQCSSCKRVGSKCSFSRVPMKRGPSKGYIKELADRLNTLENSISTGDLHPHGSGMTGEGDHSPGPSDSTSPPPNGPPSASKSRKRALSSSSDFQTSVHLQPLSQPSGRSNERLPSIDSFHPTNQHQHQQRAQHLQHEPQPQRQLPHPQQPPPPPPLPPPLTHPNQPQPHQSPIQPPPSTCEMPSGYRTISPTSMSQYWKGGPDVGGRRQSVSFPFDAPDMQRSAASSTPVDLCGFDWDDQAIDQ
ncbi:hypothetical protein DFP73DRAFT_470925 [Morchella snyderi]|nr:hypothetical protein DFP73DRAFT_470925 [Morchella snyderi]